MTATLKDKLLETIANDHLREAKGWFQDGWDWYQLSDEEAMVFGIDPDRWPVMWNTYFYYQAIKDICTDGVDRNLLDQARREHPEWKPDRHMWTTEFMDFAKEMAGMTSREANAVFEKMSWFEIRNRLVAFDDDEDDEIFGELE
jgi:hypothetical protein